MNAAQRYQVKASVFVEFIQIWLVLEIVGIQAAIIQCQIRLNIIVEFNNLKVYTFLSQLILYRVKDFRMRGWGSTDFNGYRLIRRCRSGIAAAAGCEKTSAKGTGTENG